MADGNTRQRHSSSFPEPRYSLKNSTPDEFANISFTEPGGISAIKFEAARTQFFTDVLVAVAVVVAYASY